MLKEDLTDCSNDGSISPVNWKRCVKYMHIAQSIEAIAYLCQTVMSSFHQITDIAIHKNI